MNQARPGPGSAGMMRPVFAILLSLGLLALVWLSAAGRTLAMQGQEIAAELPLAREAAARTLLAGGDSPLAPADAEALARSALARAPLHGPALVWLAVEAERGGDLDRTAELIALAARLGWHGEGTQRVLYNWAVSGGEHEAAMDRAEALIRLGRSQELLARDFAARTQSDPEFRKAWAASFAGDTRLSQSWLGRFGGRMPDAAIEALMAELEAQGTPLDETVYARIQAALLQGGRGASAAKLRALADPTAAAWLVPAWPQGGAAGSDPFAWNIPAGYDIVREGEGGVDTLVRRDMARTPRPAQVILTLPPGRYRLVAESAGSATQRNWRWSLGCGTGAPRPNTYFSTRREVTVPGDCPVQVLAVSADRRAAGEDGLPSLSIRPAG